MNVHSLSNPPLTVRVFVRIADSRFQFRLRPAGKLPTKLTNMLALPTAFLV
jgi:hypothetical protein